MADIAAANITKREFCTWGNKRCEFMTVKGDGSGVTVKTRLGRIEGAFVSPQDAAAGYNPQLSWSGGTITYAVAPLINVSHTLFVVGTD